MAGDAAATTGMDISRRADEKVFQNGEFLIGFAGSFRTGQLLKHALVPPKQKKGQDDMNFMVTTFIDAVRELQREKGSMRKDSEEESSNAAFLVGYKGKLYEVDSDFQVAVPHEEYDAIGSGSQIALGALYATRELMSNDPEQRMRLALEAAAEYNTGVRAPFCFYKTTKKKTIRTRNEIHE